MSDQTFFKTTNIIAIIAFCMPVVASYVGLLVHGNLNGADAGLAPIVVGVYNLPFMIGVAVAILVRKSYLGKSNYVGAKIASIVALIASFASLAMVVPWGLTQ